MQLVSLMRPHVFVPLDGCAGVDVNSPPTVHGLHSHRFYVSFPAANILQYQSCATRRLTTIITNRLLFFGRVT